MNAIEVRNQKLDKFYTKKEISLKCIKSLDKISSLSDFDIIVEPSAGNGSFSLQLQNLHSNVISIDIEPDHDSILKKDFFNFSIDNNEINILTIGNPPFGKVSSLAVKFFNHSATYSNVIAFILPKTFRKKSIHNKLDLNFHLIYDEDLEDKTCCFEPKMNVKCCFQIWEKMKTKRIISKCETTHKDFEFIKFGPKDLNNQPTPPLNADFAIRAYGSNVGKIFVGECLKDLRPKSYHWIKSNIEINLLIGKFNKLNYSNSHNTARQCSIGKSELVELYSHKY